MPQAKLEASRQAVSMATLLEIEELPRRRAAGGGRCQHRVGREEARENMMMSEMRKIQKPIADDDALGRGTARAVPGAWECAWPGGPPCRGSGGNATLFMPVPLRLRRLRSSGSSQRFEPRGPVGAIHPRDLLGRYRRLHDIPPGEDHEGRVGAHEAQHHEPPDVPDQGKSGHDREERRDETGRRCCAASRWPRSAAPRDSASGLARLAASCPSTAPHSRRPAAPRS